MKEGWGLVKENLIEEMPEEMIEELELDLENRTAPSNWGSFFVALLGYIIHVGVSSTRSYYLSII